MKIAVASEGKNVTEHFGHCINFNIYDAENGEIVKGESVPNPGHRPGFLPNFLADRGVKHCDRQEGDAEPGGLASPHRVGGHVRRSRIRFRRSSVASAPETRPSADRRNRKTWRWAMPGAVGSTRKRSGPIGRMGKARPRSPPGP